MSEINRIAYEISAKDAAWPVLPIIMADTQTGEIVYVSQFAAATFGYEVEELVGKPIEVLIPEKIRDAHTRWRRDVNTPNTRLMGVGRQIQGRRKSGRTFPCHVGLTSMKVLGKTIGIAFVIDLTGVAPSGEMKAVTIETVTQPIPSSSQEKEAPGSGH